MKSFDCVLFEYSVWHVLSLSLLLLLPAAAVIAVAVDATNDALQTVIKSCRRPRRASLDTRS